MLPMTPPAPPIFAAVCDALPADVVELALLLPRWQWDALEQAACGQGVSAGQLLRRCVSELLGRLKAQGS